MNVISRRQVLKLAVMGSTGLLLGARMVNSTLGAGANGVEDSTELHPLIMIDRDGWIILFAQNPDMGQGVKTSLPMILAEELGVLFEDVIIRQADWLPGQDLQFSGGSLSIRLNYQAMRKAGATARRMLLDAAAARWQVPVENLVTNNGRVHDRSGDQSASYGELAVEAAHVQPLGHGIEKESVQRHSLFQ